MISQILIRTIWNFIKNALKELAPGVDPSEVMNKAEEAVKSDMTTRAAMAVCEGIAKKMGFEEALRHPVWDSFRKKQPSEAPTHAFNSLKVMNESGELDGLKEKFGWRL